MAAHGTRYCYRTGCRCEACSTAELTYQHAYYGEVRNYRKVGRHSARRAAAHIQACRDAGMSVAQIADAAGVAQSTIRRASDPAAKLERRVIASILSICPTLPVSGIGLARRTQALSALGWTVRAIAKTADLSTCTVSEIRAGHVRQPKPAAIDGVLRAYKALSMSRPAPVGQQEKAGCTHAVRTAERNGWPPPLAWDDARIDDPREKPQGVGWQRGFVDLTEVAFLLDSGIHIEDAATRLDASLSAITRAAERHDRPDIAAVARRAERQGAAA